MGKLLEIAKATLREAGPLSDNMPELKECLWVHQAERPADLTGRHVSKSPEPIECRYDWIPGYRGLRLGCVVHHQAGGGNTVFRTNLGGYDTLTEMLHLGILTGGALQDALRVN